MLLRACSRSLLRTAGTRSTLARRTCPVPLPAPQLLRRAASSVSSDGAAARALQTILSALEEGKEGCSDTFEPSFADGILTLDLGDKGTYSLQEVDGRLLLFSPVAGPKYYSYCAEEMQWSNAEDGHLMVELLVRELMHSTSVYINL